MEFRRSSPFFSRLELRQGNLDLQERLRVRRQMRRTLAAVAVVAFIAAAVAGSIYLATPHQPLNWRLWQHRPAEQQVKTTTMTTEPGTVDLQVNKGGKSETYRFRKVGKDLVIESVTPEEGQKKPKR